MAESPFSYFSVSPKNESDIEGIIRQNPWIPVEAYASHVSNSNNLTYGPQNAINHSSPNTWNSGNGANRWIVINFTTIYIYTTHYSVQSSSCIPPECAHAKEWKTFGYQHGEWNEIDYVSSGNTNGAYFVYSRSLSNPGPFSAFKFVNAGLNYNSNTIFRFLNIDFFGSFISQSFDTSQFSSKTYSCNLIEKNIFSFITI